MFSLLNEAVERLRKGARKPRRLVNIDVHNVSAVDRPANQRPWLVLKSDGVIAETHAPMTFDDAMVGRRLHALYAGLGDRWGALMETLESVRASDEGDKAAAIEEALTAFVASMERALPKLLGSDTDGTIEKGAFARLKKVQQVVGEMIATADEGSEGPMAAKKSNMDFAGVDFEAIAKRIIDEAVKKALESDPARKSTPKSATDIVEERIAARLDRNPISVTRAVAMHEVLAADRELYERYRRENTFGSDGQALSPSLPSMDIGRLRGPDASKSATAESVDEEVARRVEQLVAKTAGATRERAMQFLFREDPALFERWRTDS